MAAAEARAVWQRTINRYFVQEDAKRAPKLACCQSSSLTSKQDDEDGEDFDGRERELEAKESEEAKDIKDISMGGGYDCMQIDDFGSSISKQLTEHDFEPYSPWISNAKTDPWWRAMDKDEVASLVARKSLDRVDNCDLPPPQKLHVKQHACSKIRCSDQGIPSHGKLQSQTLSRPPFWSHDFDPDETVGTCAASLEENVPSELHSRNTYNGGTAHIKEAFEVPDGDPCKSRLLEALRHSQTRAREAEKAAKQAHEEKEHIIGLFFRQASQLFAYKQWFHQWQLKAFDLQAENTDQPIATPVPAIHPWTPHKGIIAWTKPRKNANTRREKRGPLWLDITKYALTVALGFSLVGAGLFVGWTVGWLLPPF